MRATPALLVALLIAGCLSPGPAAPGPGGAPVPQYARDCAIATANASWPEPCLALASPNDSPSKTEIDLAVNPKDPDNVVVASKDLDPKASDCVWAVAQASKDGGRSWTTSYVGGERDARRPGEPLWGWRCITDPIMAFDADGTLFYSLQAYDHTVRDSEVPETPVPLPLGPTFGSSILAARSTDGGLTWDKIVTLHAGDGTSVFHDYMRVLVNPRTGTYHTIWNQFTQPATVVPVLVSWDGESDRADPPVYVPVPDRAQSGVTMAGFAADADGTIYVLIDDGTDGWLTTSTDDGRTFSEPVAVPQLHRAPIERQAKNNSYRTVGSYELAVDVSGGERHGWLYATISDYADEDADLLLSVSRDKGATWSDPVPVNGGEHAVGDQWMARPFVDRLGGLHVVYFDTSRDAAHYGIDATWALSVDGGATFNHTYLTAVPFDGNLGIHQDRFPFIGDYLGIGGAGDHVYMGFPTTVTGRAEIAVAKVRLPGA